MATPTLEVKPPRYSTDELIRMRSNLPVVSCVVAKLNKHPDIAVILKIPKEAFKNPEHYFCKSESLVDFRNRHKAMASHIKHTGGDGSEENEDHAPLPGDTITTITRNPQRVKWNLRQRDSSDRSSQPHSAPTGSVAQQSENFQRFYRAVVSPTHVRVTAGGRIVPNTRTPGPPQLEWNNEKLAFEPHKSSDIEIKPPRASSLPHGTLLSPSFQQLPSPGFLPHYNYNPQLSHHPLATMTTQNIGSFPSNNHAPTPSGEPAPGALNSGYISHPIKLSPPNQFDHSKPFMFNGHLVHPIPPGHQPPSHALPFSVTMIGNPNLGHSIPPAAGLFTPQPSLPMGNLPNSLMVPRPDQPSSLLASNIAQSLDNLRSFNPYLPFPGHLSVAELTKFQIEGFRNHLKFIDNQIASNNHQIDGSYMENQRTEVIAIIEKMEVMLKIQLAHEAKQITHTYLNGVMKVGLDEGPGDARHILERYGMRSTALPKEEPNTSNRSTVMSSSDVPQPPTIAFGSTEINGNKGTSNKKVPNQLEASHKSRLSAAAAMAPPFQPRSQAMVAANCFSESNTSSSIVPLDAQDEDQTIKRNPSSYPPTVLESYPSHLRADSIPDYAIYPEDKVLSLTEFNDPAISTASPHGVPYLVGTRPKGVHESETQNMDLHYPRPLNSEEIRARQLYWGKAVNSSCSGLPKFDGKDFYPPSPSKDTSCLGSDSPGTNSSNYRHSTPLTPKFEKLFMIQESVGHKTPSSHSASRQNTSVSPAQISLENVIGRLGSPASKLSPCKNEASNPAGLCSDNRASQISKHALPTQHPIDHRKSVSPVGDFSKLFHRRDIPDHETPDLQHLSKSQTTLDVFKEDGMLASLGDTESNGLHENEDYETESLDSWEAPTFNSKLDPEGTVLVISAQPGNRVDGTASAIEAYLRQKAQDGSLKRDHGNSFAGRIESPTSFEHPSMFLQSMLRNTPRSAMAAPALRTVSSATAQGCLPQYRGSAAASLVPAMLSHYSPGRDGEYGSLKVEQPGHSGDGTTAVPGSDFLTENRPLHWDQSPHTIRSSSNTPGAEEYMRYLAQKADQDKRAIKHGWNAFTTTTGTITGPNW